MSTGHPRPPLPPGSALASIRVKEIEAFMAEYSEGDSPPQDWQSLGSWAMAGAHCMFMSMIKSTYCFAEWAVEHDDLANYLAWAEISLYSIHSHHHMEGASPVQLVPMLTSSETIIYPLCVEATGERSVMVNVDQHAEFEDGLAALWLYARRCREGLEPKPAKSPIPDPPTDLNALDLNAHGLDLSLGFQPATFRKALDGIIPVVYEHLYEEIKTIGPEYMERVGWETHDKISRTTMAHMKSHDPKWFLTSNFASLPVRKAKALIELPWPVRRLVLPFLLSGSYRPVLRYAEYPENLTFFGSA